MNNNKSLRTAVILAGGKGTRLRPYTIAMPKPLVPVGDKPILELIVTQLVHYGFERIILTVNHQADIIMAYFGDGSKWGVNIEYSLEDKPLGTMGPLRLITNLPENFLVMNGDVLSDIDFGGFLEKHINSQYDFTISSYKRINKIDYGVLHVGEGTYPVLEGFEEKPQLEYSVSMGIYAASKSILEYIPMNEFYGLDNLLLDMIDKKNIGVIEHMGYWMDIGRPDDYQQACDDYMEGRINLYNV